MKSDAEELSEGLIVILNDTPQRNPFITTVKDDQNNDTLLVQVDEFTESGILIHQHLEQLNWSYVTLTDGRKGYSFRLDG